MSSVVDRQLLRAGEVTGMTAKEQHTQQINYSTAGVSSRYLGSLQRVNPY